MQEPTPKPQPSSIVQAQDQIHLTLEGQFISITAPKAMDFGIAMAVGQLLTPGYGGYELVQGLVESSHYPNRDFTGFINTFGSTGVLIDKPHNFYLQYAFHFGLLGLGLYIAVALYVVGMYLRDLRTERCSPKKGKEGFSSFKLACLMGLVCFLGCGLTNDSMSGVTSIAWILMGLLLAGVPKPTESFG